MNLCKGELVTNLEKKKKLTLWRSSACCEVVVWEKQHTMVQFREKTAPTLVALPEAAIALLLGDGRRRASPSRSACSVNYNAHAVD
jgi:hypothetical protein